MSMQLIVAGTGHRPQALGGYSEAISNKLLRLALTELEELEPTKVIAGGALGWDTAIALAAIELGIPLEMHIPCLNYESRWPPASQIRYQNIISKASNVIYIGTNYHVSLLHKRNISMVDSCDMLLALYNGGGTGGTFKCVEYAKTKNKTIFNIWEKFINE